MVPQRSQANMGMSFLGKRIIAIVKPCGKARNKLGGGGWGVELHLSSSSGSQGDRVEQEYS